MLAFRTYWLTNILAVLAVCMFWSVADAATYLTYVRDLVSTSAPATSTSQTITFTLNQAIPAGGAVVLDFDGSGLSIPGFGFNFGDVDVGFSAVSGGPYTQRPLSSIATPGTDGVSVVTGFNGRVRIDLNTSIGIAAGNEVEVRLGTNAAFSAIGDTDMVSTAATGSYPVTITTYDAGDVELDYGQTRIFVIEQVNAGPVDTTDETPPVILLAEPTGILQVGTRGVEMFVVTDELAICRYATSSMAYAVMPYDFTSTSSGSYHEWHFSQVTGLQDDTTYTYYIRCLDLRTNEIDPDYELTFTVGIEPGSATTTSTSTTGTGTGTGSSTASSTGTSDQGGDDTGTGTGSSGSGDGSSSGDGSGSGGGGGGGTGTGDKLPQASVRIEGWAYPGSTVSFMRDGVIIDTEPAEGGGEFSQLTEGLDRGSYNFSVYAVDSSGARSATFATTLWLQSDTLNVLSNVMLPPTVSVVSNSVNPGDPLQVEGYSAPNAIVVTWLRPKLAEVSTGDIQATTTATGNGSWGLTIPTSGLAIGTYELVGQATMPNGTVESDKSARMTVGVGVEVADGNCLSIGDLNCDGFVNLVDFSILLFNWNTSNAVADINGDGLVSLPDFSIMLYNWTG